MNRTYKKMADILKPVKVGKAEIDIMDFTQKELSFSMLRNGLRQDRYARLRIDGECMMSETPMEHDTNWDFVCHAHGDVLIGGLGIGMIILAIQDCPEVHSITVLEHSQDVIDAVKPQLPLNDKVRVIKADVFAYKPDRRYDCIYMDIWAEISTDVYPEMVRLKRRYGHYLKPKTESPKRFNHCWCEYYARTGKPFPGFF